MKWNPKMRHLVPATAAAAVLLAASTAPAVSIVTTADGNGADTFLENDNQGFDPPEDPVGTSTSTHGGDEFLQFRRFDGTRQKLALLRFDISTLDSSTYADAALRFNYSSNRDRTLRVYGILDDDTLDNWDEATTSYANAPGILNPGDTPAGPDAVDAEIGLDLLNEIHNGTGGLPGVPFALGGIDIVDTRSLSGSRANAVSDPATLDLEAFLNADTNGLVSFLLFHDIDNQDQTGDIAAKENTAGLGAPALGAIPEPASALLLSIAGVGLVALRRRI